MKRLPVIFFLSFLLVGCHWHHQADLVMINGMETESLDPGLIISSADQRLAGDLFEGLLRFNKSGKAVSGVAASWEVSSDGTRYLFHLRPEAYWSDGSPVVAQDFVDSWHRAMSKETACPYNYEFFVLKNGKRFINGEETDFSKVGVKALDPRTLEVQLDHPVAYFLDLCAFPTFFPVPVKLIERVGDDWTKPQYMISNGPYYLTAWRIGDRLTFEKNYYYWNQKNTTLKRVDILPISEATVAYNFYASGAADALIDKSLIPPSLLHQLNQKKDFHAKPFLSDYFLRFNCSKTPFSDPRVRKAFAMVLNSEAIVGKISQGGEVPAHSLVGKGIKGYQPIDGLSYNPEKARKLLAEAGYPGGKGFPLIKYLYSKGELDQGIAVELQAAWQKELGVYVVLDNKEWKAYLGSLTTQDYDIARSSWTADFADPSTFLDLFISGGGNNLTGWSSSEYDRLDWLASQTVDIQERNRLFQEAERLLLLDGVPVYPLFFFKAMEIYDPDKVKGIELNPIDKHPISEMYLIHSTKK